MKVSIFLEDGDFFVAWNTVINLPHLFYLHFINGVNTNKLTYLSHDTSQSNACRILAEFWLKNIFPNF